MTPGPSGLLTPHLHPNSTTPTPPAGFRPRAFAKCFLLQLTYLALMHPSAQHSFLPPG